MIEEVKFEKGVSTKLKQRISDIVNLYPSVENLEGIITLWLTDKSNSLYIGTAYDDNEQHTMVAVQFLQNRRELVTYYISRGSVMQRYTNLRMVSDFITGINEEGYGFSFDKKKLRNYKKNLGISYNYDLYQDIIPFKNLSEYIMSYAMDNIGEVRICLADKDEIFNWEEPEDKSLLSDRLLVIYLNYGEAREEKVKGMRLSFGEAVYSIVTALN